jgi:hypothetical protein
MVIGGIDAYLDHAGDEFSKASSRTGTCMHTHSIIHVTLFMSLKLLVAMGQGNSLRYLQIYTNLPMRNKTLPIPQLGCFLNRSRNSHNSKHAVAGVHHQNCEIQKRSYMVHEQEYLCYMKI